MYLCRCLCILHSPGYLCWSLGCFVMFLGAFLERGIFTHLCRLCICVGVCAHCIRLVICVGRLGVSLCLWAPFLERGIFTHLCRLCICVGVCAHCIRLVICVGRLGVSLCLWAPFLERGIFTHLCRLCICVVHTSFTWLFELGVCGLRYVCGRLFCAGVCFTAVTVPHEPSRIVAVRANLATRLGSSRSANVFGGRCTLPQVHFRYPFSRHDFRCDGRNSR